MLKLFVNSLSLFFIFALFHSEHGFAFNFSPTRFFLSYDSTAVEFSFTSSDPGKSVYKVEVLEESKEKANEKIVSRDFLILDPNFIIEPGAIKKIKLKFIGKKQDIEKRYYVSMKRIWLDSKKEVTNGLTIIPSIVLTADIFVRPKEVDRGALLLPTEHGDQLKLRIVNRGTVYFFLNTKDVCSEKKRVKGSEILSSAKLLSIPPRSEFSFFIPRERLLDKTDPMKNIAFCEMK